MKIRRRSLTCLAVALAAVTAALGRPLADGVPIRGWTILSRSEPDARATIAAAPGYGINHLQLSHHLVHDLRQIRDENRRAVVTRLTDAAHAAGITEVVLWDHALYPLEYYPAAFRTGPGGTLDLDNPEFWKWFKADYRDLLDRVPNADGLVLTFIETGARAERQHSKRLVTAQQKLAAVVEAVADVVIGERHLNLYARTFGYTYEDYTSNIGAITLVRNPKVRVMMKETPHDFFLTHPDDPYVGTIGRPTIIEFDAAGEYNGQGIIAGTWPEYFLRRWRSFARRPHVIGYTARTDRYGDTRLIGRPEEINLYTLWRAAADRNVSAEQVYGEFITKRYGAAAVPHLKPAFKLAFDIVSSSLYTLGTSSANHSKLDYDPYVSSYGRHVSGKWFDPPVVFVAHGVNREFHYWRDVINHVAPAFAKPPPNRREPADVRDRIDRRWIEPGERMTEEYLRYIVTEKAHGVAMAGKALSQVAAARDVLKPDDFEQLHHHFARTLLTARLHRATAAAYFGFRTWTRGDTHRTQFVTDTTRAGLLEIRTVARLIRDYPVKPATGGWDWTKDATAAEQYFDAIVNTGWPATTNRVPNPAAGMTFPLESAKD